MDPGAVRGIAQLVSSSVPGLSLGKVTVTDTTGQVLWPTADMNGVAGGGVSSKQAAQARYDADMASQVNAMLAQVLGPNKAMVEVNADLNENQTQQSSLTYANKGVPLTSQTQSEVLTGSGSNGTAGAAGNIPGYAALAGGKSNYRNTSTTVQNAISKTVTTATIAPGAINSQSISVMVDKTVPPGELPLIQKAVSEAVGLNAKRGDTIAVVPMSFAKQKLTAPAAAAGAMGNMMNYVKYAVIGLGALIFLFFVGRAVRKREREALMAEPTWLRELEAPRSLASIQQGPRVEMAQIPEPQTQVIPSLQSPVNVARRQVEDLVERDADRVAQQVRAWMAED
jgi:flagellar M-ring protein FliF